MKNKKTMKAPPMKPYLLSPAHPMNTEGTNVRRDLDTYTGVMPKPRPKRKPKMNITTGMYSSDQ